MFSSPTPSKISRLKLIAPVAAMLMWASMWTNLNTGFWNLMQVPTNATEWREAIQAFAPIAVVPIAFLFLLAGKGIKLPWWGPSHLLMVYGLVATFASLFSPEPMWALYWSTAFLATILAAWNFLDPRNPMGSTRQMLNVTWIATLIVASIVGYQAQGAIFGHESTGYGVVNEDLHGLSRASGVARWAAVPALVGLIRAFYSRRAVYIPLYLAAAGLGIFIVYRMQSRGAVFGMAGALLFAMFLGSRLRRYALPFLLVATALLLLFDSPATLSDQVTTYLERGQTKEEFESLTGRTRAYEHGLEAFADAPVFGRGQWADRMIIHEHVHNSYLQALMNGGIVGGVPYLLSWVTGWVLFFRLQKNRDWLLPEDQVLLLEAGTVMMFFTIRAIPETTTASFAVDLLVMVAVYVYLEALAACAKPQPQWVANQFAVPAAPWPVVPNRQPNSRGIPSL